MIRLAAALVRAWTRLYTYRMKPSLREARRAEIESDLWELEADARLASSNALHTSLHILARLIFGVVNDLLWRYEHMTLERRRRRSLWVTLTTSAIIGAAWILLSERRIELPAPPASPISVTPILRAPSPPPPPPPPPRVLSK